MLYDRFGVDLKLGTLKTGAGRNGGDAYQFDLATFVPVDPSNRVEWTESDWLGAWNDNYSFTSLAHDTTSGVTGQDWHPSGGEPYDVEGLYFDNDEDNYYFVAVTSSPHFTTDGSTDDVGIVDPIVVDATGNYGVDVRSGDIAISFFQGVARDERGAAEWHYNYGIDVTQENRDVYTVFEGGAVPTMRSLAMGTGLYATSVDAGGSNMIGPDATSGDWYTSAGPPSGGSGSAYATEAEWEHTNFDPLAADFTGTFLGNVTVNYYEFGFAGGLKENDHGTYVFEVTIPRSLFGANDRTHGEQIGFRFTPGCRNDGNGTEGSIQLVGTVDDLEVGDLVFEDTNDNGIFEPGSGETGINGVDVQLFASGTPTSGTPIATTATATMGGQAGRYLFTALPEGDYYIHIPNGEFQGGGSLENMASSGTTEADPDDDENEDGSGSNGTGSGSGSVSGPGDENGIDNANPGSNGISSGVFTLGDGEEPTGEDLAGIQMTELDANSNLTVDFGFVPCGIDSVVVSNVQRQSLGTVDPSDDTFTFDLTVTATNGSASGWTSSNPNGSGAFGVAEGYGPFPVSGGNVTVNVEDADDSGCTGQATANVPAHTWLALGNLVFNDLNDDGIFDADGVDNQVGGGDDETGVDGVKIELWSTTNGTIGDVDDAEVLVGPDGLLGTGDDAAGGMSTDSSGCYLFGLLPAGSYYVKIPAGEFGNGEPLYGRISSTGQGADKTTDDNDGTGANGDENGDDNEADGVTSNIVALAVDGEPTEAGKDASNTANVADNNNVNLTVDLGFTCPVLTLASVPAVLPDAYIGVSYSATINAGNGSGGYTYGVTGSLPAGLTLDTNNGNITGTPTAVDTGTFTVTATDDSGCSVSAVFNIDVPTATISGTTYEDTTGDGNGNTPINITTVRLCNAAGDTAIDNPNSPGNDYVITTSNGSYTFTNLAPGSYTVKQDQPDGYLNVSDGDSTVDDDDLPENEDTTDDSIPVTVVDGETDDGNDFVEVLSMSIGDFVFCDDNNNGIYEPIANGETGIDGVEVKLFHDVLDDGNFVEIATQTTDGGDYQFTGLYPGDYQVVVTDINFAKDGALEFKSMSSTTTDTNDNGENDDDNGIQTAPGQETTSPVITLEFNGEPGNGGGTMDDHTVDFGFTDPVGVGNLVFIDGDGDGVYDGGAANGGIDLPVEHVTLEIYDAAAGPGVGLVLASTETDKDGCYLFTDLLPGNYIVHIPAAEFQNADDGDGFGLTGELVGQTSVTGAINFAVIDDNNPYQDNGLDSPDPASTGISSGAVALSFGNAPLDDTETGKGGVTDEPDGNVDLTVDFGFRSETGLVGVGNLVFNDVNGDGDFDSATESGIDNVILLLFPAGADPQTAQPIAGTTTHSGGCYHFGGLAPGGYFVQVFAQSFASGQPLDGLVSSAGAGGDTGHDDDADENGLDTADPETNGVSSLPVVLASGGEINPLETGKASDSDDLNGNEDDHDLSIDFGFTAATVGIGNFVFYDDDADGVYETGDGDVGIDDVLVELYLAADEPGSDTPVATTVTTGGGCYLFTGLAASEDYVVHIPASNFAGVLAAVVSSYGAGGDDGLDDNAGENGIDTPNPEVSGVTSASISLVAGTEPDVSNTENGKDSDADNTVADDSHDLTVDFAFTAPGGGGIGNKVFADDDRDGVLDTGESGIDGVIVELYPGGADPLATSPLQSTITAGGGCYYFSGLPDGDYFVHIPPSQFAATEALESLVSSPGNGGDDGTDDDGNENGIDSVDPATTGVSSGVIALAAGSEGAESGAGGGDDNTNEDANDLTVDLGFATAAGPVGIGNLVFLDENNDGQFNDADDRGIDGVTVELYLSSAPPGSGSAVASAETHSGGCYLFAGLAPGSYIVHIPDAEFLAGGALANLDSLPGAGSDQTTDDTGAGGDENGDDNTADGVSSNTFVLAATGMPADGDTETGKDASGDNANDAAVNLTADFGFVGKPATYAAFQNEFAAELGAESAPDDNPDGDIYNNALEYALCDHPGSGDNANPFCVELGAGTGTVDAMFVRLEGGLSDVTYTLMVASVLGSPPFWQTSNVVPTVTPNGDGTETVTFANLELQNAAGIARLQVDIAGDGTGPHYTPTFGWHTQTNTAACETCSFPYARKSEFSGTSSTAGPALMVSGTPDLGSGDYYIEVLDGLLAGHRFDVASTAADTVTLNTTSARNTLAPLPDLSGAPFALRPHSTLASIAPPGAFTAKAFPTDPLADRILAYSDGVWTTYGVTTVNGPSQWVDAGDGGFPDGNDTVVDACEGFFLHPQNADVTLTMVGVVREWPFACPLGAGFNLVGSGYPADQSPAGREMLKIDGDDLKDWFTASNDPLTADQVMFWLGDGIAAAEGYDTYFRVDLGHVDYDHWTYQGDSNLDDYDTDALFKRGRGAFYDMTAGHDRSVPADVWLWPSPWDPNLLPN